MVRLDQQLNGLQCPQKSYTGMVGDTYSKAENAAAVSRFKDLVIMQEGPLIKFTTDAYLCWTSILD